MKIETINSTLLPLVSLDTEVEARAFDIKFTDLISMENNIGISAGFSANLPAKNHSNTMTVKSSNNIGAFSALTFETLAYYQPSVKFKVLDDLALKVGLKVGAGATIGFDKNTHKTFPTFVTSFIAGAEYKNIIVETEVVADTRLEWKPIDDNMIPTSMESSNSEPNQILKAMVFPNFKIKAGYRF